MVTKEKFLATYAEELRALGFDWMRNQARFDRFIDVARSTIFAEGGSGSWSHTGPATRAAWRRLGLAGKPTMKALRALPSERAEGQDAAFAQQISPAATGL